MTLTGQGKSRVGSSCSQRMRSWLSRPPPVSLDISMISPRSAMNSANVGLSVLEFSVLRVFDALPMLVSAE